MQTILGAIVQMLGSIATWRPGFVQAYLSDIQRIELSLIKVT
jgi:hypothetical protein